MTSEEPNGVTSESPQPNEQGGTPPQGGEGQPAQETTSTGEPEPGVNERQQRRDERWRERAVVAEETVGRLVRGEVLRELTGRVSDPAAALRLGEVDVLDLLTDEGDVDSAEVESLANELLTKYPSLQPRTHHGDIGAKSTSQQAKPASWSQVFKQK